MPFAAPENPRPVRAKVYVRAIELNGWATKVTLGVVTRGEDNKEWAAATPTGEAWFTIANEVAADQFAPGQEWFIDFIPVPVEKQGEEGMA